MLETDIFVKSVHACDERSYANIKSTLKLRYRLLWSFWSWSE